MADAAVETGSVVQPPPIDLNAGFSVGVSSPHSRKKPSRPGVLGSSSKGKYTPGRPLSVAPIGPAAEVQATPIRTQAPAEQFAVHPSPFFVPKSFEPPEMSAFSAGIAGTGRKHGSSARKPADPVPFVLSSSPPAAAMPASVSEITESMRACAVDPTEASPTKENDQPSATSTQTAQTAPPAPGFEPPPIASFSIGTKSSKKAGHPFSAAIHAKLGPFQSSSDSVPHSAAPAFPSFAAPAVPTFPQKAFVGVPPVVTQASAPVGVVPPPAPSSSFSIPPPSQPSASAPFSSIPPSSTPLVSASSSFSSFPSFTAPPHDKPSEPTFAAGVANHSRSRHRRAAAVATALGKKTDAPVHPSTAPPATAAVPPVAPVVAPPPAAYTAARSSSQQQAPVPTSAFTATTVPPPPPPHVPTGAFTATTVPPPPRPAQPERGPSPISTPARADAPTPAEAAAKHRVKGNELFKAGKYAAAVSAYADAIRCDATDHLSLANKAAAHLMLDQFAQAAADAEASVDLVPTLVKGISRAVRAYVALGHTRKAKSMAFRLAPDCTDPDAAEIRDILSRIKQFEERCTEARAALAAKRERDALRTAEAACHIFPLDLDGRFLKTRALIALGKFADAIPFARAGLPTSLSGDLAQAPHEFAREASQKLFIQLVTAVWCAEGTEKALLVLNMELEANVIPPLRELKSMITRAEKLKLAGNEAFNAKEYDSALASYAKAISTIADSPNMKFKVILLANKVAALMAQGKFREAHAEATTALKMESTHVKVRLRRARCSVELAHFDAAVRDFEQAMADMRVASAPAADIESVRVECVAARERLASKKAADTLKQSRAPPPPPATPPPSVDEFPNHYATLGVPEFTAALPEIKKAYHKLALKYHPDKVASRMDDHGGAMDLKAAEAMFKRVSEAYSVLTDPTSRSKFDRELREHRAESARRRPGAGAAAWAAANTYGGTEYDSRFFKAYFAAGGGRAFRRR